MQGLLRLGDKFGADRLEGVCVLMREADIVSVKTVRQMLEKGLDQQNEKLESSPSVYRNGGHFYRSPNVQMVMDMGGAV